MTASMPPSDDVVAGSPGDSDEVGDAPTPPNDDGRSDGFPQADEPVDEPDPDEDPTTPDVSERLDEIYEQLRALRTAEEGRHRDAQKEKRTLAQQVDDLRAWQLTESLKPAFQQLVALHADLMNAADAARSEEAAELADDYEHFVGAVERVLDHFDLASVEAAQGGAFDRREHAAVMSKPTTDPAQDQTIARVVRQGFRVLGAERVLIPARVVVLRYQGEDGNAASDTDSESPS